MKNLILFFAAVLLTAVSANVFAQGTGTVPNIGDVHWYSVTENATSSYVWTVTTDVAGTVPATGVDILTGATSDSVQIQWTSPTPGTPYYVHILETDTSAASGCSNRKALQVIPQNAFKLEIENFAMGVDTTQDYSICPADVIVQSYDGNSDGSLAQAQSFTYNYQKDSVFYKIYASGINTVTTTWGILLDPSYTPGGLGVATYYYSTDGTSFSVLPGDGLVTVDDGSSEVTVKAVIDNGTTHDGTTAQNVTLVLVDGEDIYGNKAIDLGNGSRNQIVKARPATTGIITTN